MRRDELNKILELHAQWVADPETGERADLSETDLDGAWLSGADLRKADLSETWLSGACLSGADLRGANLAGANLTEAYLRGADLRGADLPEAYLRGADLTGARGIVSAGPVGAARRMIYAVDHGDCVMVQTGCRWDSADVVLAAIAEHYADSPLRESYEAAVRWCVMAIEAGRGER